MNLAGPAVILEMKERLRSMRAELDRLHDFVGKSHDSTRGIYR